MNRFSAGVKPCICSNFKNPWPPSLIYLKARCVEKNESYSAYFQANHSLFSLLNHSTLPTIPDLLP